MPPQQNLHGRPLRPGPSRFTLSANKFSKVAAQDTNDVRAARPERRPLQAIQPKAFPPQKDRPVAAEKPAAKHAHVRVAAPAPPPDPATRFQVTSRQDRRPAVPGPTALPSNVGQSAASGDRNAKRTKARVATPAPRPDPATRFNLIPGPSKALSAQSTPALQNSAHRSPAHQTPAQRTPAIPAARPDPATRYKLTPSPPKTPTTPQTQTQPNSNNLSRTTTARDKSQSNPHRPLASLSTDEFCTLAAHSTSAQIAEQYAVKTSSVHSQLSKVVRQKADEEGRTIDNVKDELNQKRVANGVIPVVDGRYGVRTLPPRARLSGGTMKAPSPGVLTDNEDEGEEMEVELDVTVGAARGPMGSALTETELVRPSDEEDSQVIADTDADEVRGIAVMDVGMKNAASGDEMADPQPVNEDEMQITSSGTSNEDPMDVEEEAAEEGIVPESTVESQHYEGMQMPMEVLHNNEAYRLWVLGYRQQAVEKAEETIPERLRPSARGPRLRRWTMRRRPSLDDCFAQVTAPCGVLK